MAKFVLQLPTIAAVWVATPGSFKAFADIPSVFLVDQAVFTAVARATSHFGAERVAEVSGHERGFGAPSPWPF